MILLVLLCLFTQPYTIYLLPIVLNIFKQFVDIPATWETAICTDICYSSTVSSVNLYIAPADSQEFVFYFYTDLVADSGYAKVLFTNLNVPSNTVLHGYHGITLSPLSVSEQHGLTFSVYPNPAIDFITVKSNKMVSDESYVITDELGRIVQIGALTHDQALISIQELPKGFYLLNFEGFTSKIVKQ